MTYFLQFARHFFTLLNLSPLCFEEIYGFKWLSRLLKNFLPDIFASFYKQSYLR
jgi:hypothetical protein